jgi:hypothetical protein
MACSSEWVIVSLDGQESWWPRLQASVRGSASVNLGGSRTTQVPSELVMQFSALSYSLETERKEEKRQKKKKKKEREKPLTCSLAWLVAATVPDLPWVFCAI